MGGTSLTVTNILNFSQDVFEKRTFSLENQTSLNKYGVDDRLGWRKTELNNRIEKGGFVTFNVLISTELITDPIYIYDDEYIEWKEGYQQINEFKIRLDEKKSNLYIFSNKKTAKTFLTRLKNAEVMEFSNILFDFSRIEELDNLDSAWGSWEDSNGIIRRTGKFGKGLNAVIEDYSNITTLFIDYVFNRTIIQLILSREGRIYASKDLSNDELLRLFNEISDVLVVD